MAILSVVVCFALSACTVDLAELIRKDRSFVVTVYDGRPMGMESSREFHSGTAGYSFLIDWAEKNRQGWKPSSLVTYVPYVLLWNHSHSFQLNITPSYAVLGAGEVQYTKDMDIDEYRHFMGLVENDHVDKGQRGTSGK